MRDSTRVALRGTGKNAKMIVIVNKICQERSKKEDERTFMCEGSKTKKKVKGVYGCE